MRAALHTQGWSGSEPTEPGEEPTALLHGVLQLDGHFVENAKVKFETDGNGFAMLTAELLVVGFDVIVHDTESWKQMQAAIEDQNGTA